MKKTIFIIGIVAVLAGLLSSCKKTIENHQIALAYKPPVHGITSTTLGVEGSSVPTAYAGTLITGTTYTVVGDILVNYGDTLFIEPGVNICVEDTSCICVKGVLISIGTQTNPVIITDCNAVPNNTLGQPYSTDPAWNHGTSPGWWCGINCDTSCTLLLLKWTQIWFTGAAFKRQEPIANTAVGSNSYGIFFQRTSGNFIMEDCKMYGSINDGIRVQTGQFELMRSVFEKCGNNTNEAFNVKSGGVGDCAYNLFIGIATNGSKGSNKGGSPVQCNMAMYNNTYINCGWRQSQAAHGANINYEQNAKGAAYNNLIVDCKVGLRIVSNPIADTAHLWYSNNFIYGDSLNVTEEFYPNPLYITKTDCYIAPIPTESGYVYNPNGSGTPNVADATNLIGANPVNFVGFPTPENFNLPLSAIDNYEAPNNFNFKLQSNSPCVGTGTTVFPAGYPIYACSSVYIPLLPNGFASGSFTPDESLPCNDIGCYPFSNPAIGNQQ